MKCIKCGAEALNRWSPDLDIKGIGFCDEHQEEVMDDILVASLGNEWDWFQKKYELKDEEE